MFDQKGGKRFLEVVGLGESFQAVEEDEAEAEAVDIVEVDTGRLV
jgi:hypothetical protein